MIRQMCDVLIDIKNLEGLPHDDEDHVLIDTEPLDAIWAEWRRKAESDAVLKGDEAEGIFLKRASVIAWRACCVMWVLWGLDRDEKTLSNLHDEFFWLADIVLREQVALFGEALAKAQFGRKHYENKPSLFDQLPREFKWQDMASFNGNLTQRNASTYLTRWLKRGLIVRLGTNHYQKTK